MKHATSILALVVAVGLLAAATPGQAIYIVTPLLLDGDTHEADVGDEIDLSIRPHPDDANATRDWGGKTVRVGYSFDKNENAEGGGPDSSTDNSGYTERFLPDDVTLTDDATGTFTWTIPAEVDDLNVHIFLEADGERLAFYNIGVGDAMPVMYVASGPSGGEPENGDGEPLMNEDGTEEASALGLVGLVGALGAALLGASQLRRRQ